MKRRKRVSERKNENFTVSILAISFVTLAKLSRGIGLEPFGEHYIFWCLL